MCLHRAGGSDPHAPGEAEGHWSSLVFTIAQRPAAAVPSTPTSMRWWESWREGPESAQVETQGGARCP